MAHLPTWSSLSNNCLSELWSSLRRVQLINAELIQTKPCPAENLWAFAQFLRPWFLSIFSLAHGPMEWGQPCLRMAHPLQWGRQIKHEHRRGGWRQCSAHKLQLTSWFIGSTNFNSCHKVIDKAATENRSCLEKNDAHFARFHSSCVLCSFNGSNDSHVTYEAHEVASSKPLSNISGKHLLCSNLIKPAWTN